MRITALFAAAALTFAACGNDGSNADMSPPDLEPPPPDLAPPPRAATDHPMPANVIDQGGRLLKNPELVTVVWQGDPLAAERGRFGDWIATSDFMGLLSEYGIGLGTHKGIYTIPQPGPMSLDDSEIGPLMRDQIRAGNLPAPGPNTIYLLYLPNGTQSTQGRFGSGCVDYDGYHWVFPTGGLGSTPYAAYAVMCPCVVNDSQLDADTITASHEIAEAATDPTEAGWMDPNMPLSEVGDLCTPLNATYDHTFSDGQMREYLVNRVWSAKVAAAGNDDPCLPKPPLPYQWFGVGMSPNIAEIDRDTSGNGSIDIDIEPFSYGGSDSIAWQLQLYGSTRGLTISKTHGHGLPGSTQVVTITANAKAISGTSSVWITSQSGGYQATWFGALTIN